MPSTDCNIYIVTGEIQSGKSTELLKWISEKEKEGMSVGGFLNVVIDGKKWFHDISTHDRWLMEEEDQKNNAIKIGRYAFSFAAFARAKKLLVCSKNYFDYFIIDEIGKLELKQKGLESSLSKFLVTQTCVKNLILVVRKQLVDEVIKAYQLTVKEIIVKEGLDQIK
ncbi:MAG: hypothetical protein HRT61_23435 [Ekhidna sp.]|nr:hypothetical protein [Ekhidna sp.]